MNKTMKWVTVLTVGAALAVSASPLFAHHHGGYGGGYGGCYGGGYGGGYGECEWCLGSDWCLSQPVGHHHTDRCYYPVQQGNGNGMRGTNMPPRPNAYVPNGAPMGFAGGGKVTTGTVSATDKDASTITLTNADGESVVVHVSPFTRLVGVQAAPAANGTSRVIGPAPTLSVADIPAGSSVLINVYDTDTKTLEAARVLVR